jgi:LytS/YehU family sensor histidine kinase
MRDGDFLVISMSNPVAVGEERAKSGNKMAMTNIQQRFELAYDGRGTVDIERADNSFTVRLRFPYEEQSS